MEFLFENMKTKEDPHAFHGLQWRTCSHVIPELIVNMAVTVEGTNVKELVENVLAALTGIQKKDIHPHKQQWRVPKDPAKPASWIGDDRSVDLFNCDLAHSKVSYYDPNMPHMLIWMHVGGYDEKKSEHELKVLPANGEFYKPPHGFHFIRGGVGASVFETVEQHKVLVNKSEYKRYPFDYDRAPLGWVGLKLEMTTQLETGTFTFLVWFNFHLHPEASRDVLERQGKWMFTGDHIPKLHEIKPPSIRGWMWRIFCATKFGFDLGDLVRDRREEGLGTVVGFGDDGVKVRFKNSTTPVLYQCEGPA